MGRSRKSQIASAARSREREGGGEERLDKREKASKKGGSYACAQQCHSGVAARNGKNRGGGVGVVTLLQAWNNRGQMNPWKPASLMYAVILWHFMIYTIVVLSHLRLTGVFQKNEVESSLFFFFCSSEAEDVVHQKPPVTPPKSVAQ